MGSVVKGQYLMGGEVMGHDLRKRNNRDFVHLETFGMIKTVIAWSLIGGILMRLFLMW